MKTVTALIIQPDGTARIDDIEATATSLNDLVGGWLTAIRPSTDKHGNWICYLDEEGLLKQEQRPNPAGTAFAASVGWAGSEMLVGPMVFLGTGGEGAEEEADVPPEVVGAAVRLWGIED